MKQNELGIVISTEDSPSTSKISFVCINKTVHKGEYIQIKYSQGTLVGLVIDVLKRNRYFENNESVKEFELNNVNIFEQFPTNEWEFLEGIIKPLGVLTTEERFTRSTLPVSPGDKVEECDSNILSKFLHFQEDGLHLGTIENPSLEVKFNLDRLLQKHLAILAQSGAGKSYLTSVILEELLDVPASKGRIAVVLVDTHGEYSNFSEPTKDKSKKDYSSQTIKIKANDIKIGVTGLSDYFLFNLLTSLSSAQKRELSIIIKKLNEDKKHGAGPFDLKDIIKEIENSTDIKDTISRPLINALYELTELRLFSKTDSPSVYDVVAPGKLTIIDLSNEINQKKKQLILSYFAHKLFHGRVNRENVPPFLLVVEEAHQFAPEMVQKDRALAKGILETIAREGRKFGACLCLISQRPVRLSTTVLSQANTHIILRITNPYDLKHIGESSEGLDSKSIEMITSLRVGEALVVGEASNYPVFFKVRKKRSQDSILDVTLSGLAKNYENKKEEEKKDVESFL